MSRRGRMVCGNDPRAELSDGDRQAVDDFKAWLKAKADSTRDDLLHTAAEQVRPSSRSVAVVLPPAVADALADLLDMCANARGRFPYEAFLLARRVLEEQPAADPDTTPRAEQ